MIYAYIYNLQYSAITSTLNATSYLWTLVCNTSVKWLAIASDGITQFLFCWCKGCFIIGCYIYFWRLTDTMGRMHSDAQFAGSSSVPAHVEMMGFLGIGNNPMVG